MRPAVLARAVALVAIGAVGRGTTGVWALGTIAEIATGLVTIRLATWAAPSTGFAGPPPPLRGGEATNAEVPLGAITKVKLGLVAEVVLRAVAEVLLEPGLAVTRRGIALGLATV